MLSLLHSEIFRFFRRTLPQILLLILVVTVLASYLFLWAILRSLPQDTGAQQGLDNLRTSLSVAAVPATGMGIVRSLGTVLGVILAASTIGAEFRWGTIRTLLPRTPGRSAFLTVKLIPLLLFIVIATMVGYVAALEMSLLIMMWEGMDRSFGEGFLLRSRTTLGGSAFVMLPYAALALLVALWTRSSAAGIAVGLATYFLEWFILLPLGFVGGPVRHLPKVLLGANVQVVVQATASGISQATPPSSDLPNPWQAGIVLTCYTIVFIALTYWQLHHRDITS
jgi:ABC-2 type transport system permease protein